MIDAGAVIIGGGGAGLGEEHLAREAEAEAGAAGAAIFVIAAGRHRRAGIVAGRDDRAALVGMIVGARAAGGGDVDQDFVRAGAVNDAARAETGASRASDRRAGAQLPEEPTVTWPPQSPPVVSSASVLSA